MPSDTISLMYYVHKCNLEFRTVKLPGTDWTIIQAEVAPLPVLSLNQIWYHRISFASI